MRSNEQYEVEVASEENEARLATHMRFCPARRITAEEQCIRDISQRGECSLMSNMYEM